MIFDSLQRGGAMQGGIQYVTFDFDSHERVSIEQARPLFVKAAQKLIDRMNANPEILQYVQNNRFGPENLSFGIAFVTPNVRVYYPPPYMAYVLMVNKRIIYSIHNPETTLFEKVYEETFEEAVEKLKGQQACH